MNASHAVLTVDQTWDGVDPRTKTVVAYCRISADKTGAGLGAERQAMD